MGVLVKPIITEKLTANAEKTGRYGFVVEKSANKLEIKNAVEKMYGVTVKAVNTMNYIGKVRSRYTKTGMQIGIANRHKKAIVTLKKGDAIDFYSNL
ncbi:MAG TPA: 50S ribosomal protein L23 [Bacteroidia bacterium]|jgi:large subunit ribosomal protein L23|nr:50S ribosomal protein L23 [Bacteroidia bacterium]